MTTLAEMVAEASAFNSEWRRRVAEFHPTSPVPSGTIQAAPVDADSLNGWDWVTGNGAMGRIEPPPGYHGPGIPEMLGLHPLGAPMLEGAWGTRTWIDIDGNLHSEAITKAETLKPSPVTAEAATAAERARILAKLQELRPTETQYTRIQWRWEEKGAQAMFDKIMRAIEGGE